MKRIATILTCLVLLWAPAQADPVEPKSRKGPVKISLESDLAEINLPKGFEFLDKETTKQLLSQSGNKPDGNEIGSIFLSKDPESFAVFMAYDKQGYVKDDEADKINADELLQSYKDGTEAANEDRKKAGVPELHVTGWGEKPHYDKQLHHLIWALIADSAGSKVVNFETRVLGREGVMSMTLVCDPKDLERFKPMMKTLLASTSYTAGKRYADFTAGDKVSDVGLIALVAGGAAAAKLGILAKLGKFLLVLLVAGKKFLVFLLIGLGTLLKRFFGGGSSASEDANNPVQE